MKIDILTLFPNMFSGIFTESIIKRAIESKKVSINVVNIRDYSKDIHKRVDDYSYGGGAGMVLMCEPIFRAIRALKTESSVVIMLTPSGEVFRQDMAFKRMCAFDFSIFSKVKSFFCSTMGFQFWHG